MHGQQNIKKKKKDSLLQNPSVLQVIKEYIQVLHHIQEIFLTTQMKLV